MGQKLGPTSRNSARRSQLLTLPLNRLSSRGHQKDKNEGSASAFEIFCPTKLPYMM